MKKILEKVMNKKNLSQDEAYQTMKDIMLGKVTSPQIAGLLVALRMKGESVDEVAGLALAMRDAATQVALQGKEIVDNCGTGGDGKGSFNISTAAAIVVAGAGFHVAKHGNRSISSKCGSADVLEVMGVKINPPTALVERCIDEVGMGFLFAPNFHPAMKFAMPTRKELGVRTVFNILGPLTNPARASVQLIGVYDPKISLLIAEVLKKMGHRAGLVVHSEGWDEILLDKSIAVVEMVEGSIREHVWTNESFGLDRVDSSDLKGGDVKQNAQHIFDILDGKKGPKRDVVVANAAALIWIATRAFRKKEISLTDAVGEAQTSIDSGKAKSIFSKMAETTQCIE